MMKTSTGLILVACVVAMAMGGCRSATPLMEPPAVLDQKFVYVDSTGALSGAVEQGIVFFDRPGQVVIWKHKDDKQLDIEFGEKDGGKDVFERVKTAPESLDSKSFKVKGSAYSTCMPYKYTIKLEDREIDPVIIIRD